MLTRQLRNLPARAGIWYDTWLLNQAKRRWLKHGRYVMSIPGWASKPVSKYLYTLQVEHASQRWAVKTADISLPKWAAAMDSAAARMKGTTRHPDPRSGGDGAPGG